MTTSPFPNPFRLHALLFAALLLVCSVASARSEYGVDYTVQFLPQSGQAQVTIKLTPGEVGARRLRLTMPEDRYTAVSGDGEVVRKGAMVTWTPLRDKPSKLRYRYRIDHQRRDGGYDARITDDWVIVRGDDLVPSARVSASKGADSRVRLRFVLPKGWSNVDTPFLRSRDGKSFVVVNPERRFDRPIGWIIAGAVGTRREFLGDTEISVAGPKGDVIRRNDMLAFFNNLVPEFERAFGKLPPKLLIVSAGDPMWRGGLSGPRSLFLHADRPLISENGTSTLTHELTHVITRIRGADGDDWIAEGLAEFYSIELLRRAGLLSPARADKAQEWMARHGRGIKSLSANRSHGPRTARAVQLFRELDAEIRKRSKNKHSLDDVVRALIPLREVSREDLGEQVAELTGAPSAVLATPLLD
jgi:predicted metalloprotease with PDZ domain